MPRNLKQIQNLKQAFNKQKRFTRDELYNVHVLHTNIGFPREIYTAPDLRAICYDSKLLDEIKNVINAVKMPCFLSYDTTFNLCGYYVSVLVLKHPFLLNRNKTEPPIPFIFYFHENKNEISHNFLFNSIKRVILYFFIFFILSNFDILRFFQCSQLKHLL